MHKKTILSVVLCLSQFTSVSASSTIVFNPDDKNRDREFPRSEHYRNSDSKYEMAKLALKYLWGNDYMDKLRRFREENRDDWQKKIQALTVKWAENYKEQKNFESILKSKIDTQISNYASVEDLKKTISTEIDIYRRIRMSAIKKNNREEANKRMPNAEEYIKKDYMRQLQSSENHKKIIKKLDHDIEKIKKTYSDSNLNKKINNFVSKITKELISSIIDIVENNVSKDDTPKHNADNIKNIDFIKNRRDKTNRELTRNNVKEVKLEKYQHKKNIEKIVINEHNRASIIQALKTMGSSEKEIKKLLHN